MIRNYVELEKIRFDQRLDLAIHCTGDMHDKSIAPLLLLPFLENCFKHGVSQQIDQCWVFIDLLADKNTFHAKFINSRLNTQASTEEPVGIGLINVRRRLDLLYGNNYKLKIMPAEETFTVSLVLSFGALEFSHELN
jgi:LytS/YehU family sensor histidine kinase